MIRFALHGFLSFLSAPYMVKLLLLLVGVFVLRYLLKCWLRIGGKE